MPGIVEGKVAIVTGAGRGIGRAIAMLMAAEGAKVLINDVGAALDGSGGDTGPAQQVVDEIKKAGGQAIASTLSIGDPANGDKVVQAALDAFGRIDEAAKYCDLDQLCLSGQCGFASTEEGNTLTEAEQWAKLRLIVEVAEEVWGR